MRKASENARRKQRGFKLTHKLSADLIVKVFLSGDKCENLFKVTQKEVSFNVHTSKKCINLISTVRSTYNKLTLSLNTYLIFNLM